MKLAQAGRAFWLGAIGAQAVRLVGWLAVGLALLVIWAARGFVFEGDLGALNSSIRLYGSVFLIGLAAVEYLLALVCWRLFEPGERLRPAWLLLSFAAACRLLGLIGANLYSGFAFWGDRPFRGPAAEEAGFIREISLTFSTPISAVFMVVGLFIVLRAYKSLGMLRRPGIAGAIGLVATAVFLVFEGLEFARWLAGLTAPAPPIKWLSWLNDPLIGLLLLEAVLLARAASAMQGGLIGSCWRAYAVAIFLTALGELGIWATNYGWLPWQYVYVNSCVWMAAAAGFALAPAYQVEAIVRAKNPWLSAA